MSLARPASCGAREDDTTASYPPGPLCGQASARTTPLQHRIDAAGEDLASVVGRLPARPRRQSGEAKPLEVIPFDQLLRGN